MEVLIVNPKSMDSATKKRVNDNRKNNVCIACGEKPQYKRELCTTCHGRFMNSKPTNKKAAKIYEANLISKGLLGEDRQGQRIKNNPYKNCARKAEEQARA